MTTKQYFEQLEVWHNHRLRDVLRIRRRREQAGDDLLKVLGPERHKSQRGSQGAKECGSQGGSEGVKEAAMERRSYGAKELRFTYLGPVLFNSDTNTRSTGVNESVKEKEG